MRGVLILYAHPAQQRSRINESIIASVSGLEGITVNDLYDHYPDFAIDVAREQELLEAHDVVIMQHPFFWYSTPAILKEWQDLVLEHGWAYGSRGTALEGKLLLSVISTGGKSEAYSHDGYNGHTVRELLAPIAQTASLCGMRFLPPFLVQGTHLLADSEIETAARLYRRLVEALRDDAVVIPEGSGRVDAPAFSWEEALGEH